MRNRILLIEDDPETSSILQRQLTKAGYEVAALSEGREIVEGNFECPDLFILDNYLPAIEGIALCKYLRLQPGTQCIPVIVISGNAEVAKKIDPAGANYFIRKPFSLRQLLAVVQLCIPYKPKEAFHQPSRT